MGNLRFLFVALLLTNGVFSKETASSEKNSFENEETTELSGCYGGETSSWEKDLGFAMEAAAVDTNGKRCYKAVSNREVRSLFTKSGLEEAFVNVRAEICPSWTRSKECLRHHLSRKCDSVETQNVRASNGFNSRLVASELLCEPLEDYTILQMFKDAAMNGSLGDCLGDQERHHELGACSAAYAYRNKVPPFTEYIPLVFECGDKTIKVCANGNLEQELALNSLWNKFRKAVQASHGSLWNQLNAPASILDLLK